MNKSNTKFFGLASLGLLVALMPVACSSDDDDDNGNSTAGTSTTGGMSTNGGTSSTGGGGKSSTAGTSGSTSTAGSINLGGGGTDDGGAGGAGGGAAVTTSRLRVVHASPNAPAVDVYPKGSTTAAIKNVEYGKSSGFIEVDAGTIAFDLRAAGADSSDAPAFTTPDIDLAAGAEYTLVAAGDFAKQDDDDVGFRVLPLEH